MRAEIGTHFDNALKTSLRENFLKKFAILSESCAASALTRAPDKPSFSTSSKKHYITRGYNRNRHHRFQYHNCHSSVPLYMEKWCSFQG
jgi:hypothetical protein